MNIGKMLKSTEKMLSDNSPLILTAVGVTGTITTAYLASIASFRAAQVLEEAREEKAADPTRGPGESIDLTAKEKVDRTWKLYIPAATTGVLTVTAIVFANRIGTRRAAAVATAYALSERSFEQYRDKVIKTIGENKETAIRDEIAKDRVDALPGHREVIIAGSGEVLCLDSTSQRYFNSNMEALRRAENDINFQILHADYATLSNFYANIGLEPTSISDDMGWNTDKRMELHFSSVLTQEGRPVLVVDFATIPIRDPWRFC